MVNTSNVGRPRVAVIGCGVIGRVHAWSLAGLGSAVPALLIDRDITRAQALRDDLVAAFPHLTGDAGATSSAGGTSSAGAAAEPSVRVATSPAAAWLSPDIDAVTIALPHYLHREMFEQCVLAGKHVLCEKPYATTVADLRAMQAVAAASPVKTMGVFQHRYAPMVRLLRQSIRDGLLGRVTAARLEFRCKRDADYYDSEDWRGSWDLEGGSLLINQAIHSIDLLVFLLGAPQWVSATVGREWVPNIETEDWARATFGFGDVASAWLEPELIVEMDAENTTDTGWSPRIVLTTERGTIGIMGSDTVESCTVADPQWSDALLAACKDDLGLPQLPGKADYSNLHTAQFRDFIDWVTAGPHSNYRPWLDFVSVTTTNELVLAMYTAAARGERVPVPLTTAEDFAQPRDCTANPQHKAAHNPMESPFV